MQGLPLGASSCEECDRECKTCHSMMSYNQSLLLPTFSTTAPGPAGLGSARMGAADYTLPDAFSLLLGGAYFSSTSSLHRHCSAFDWGVRVLGKCA